MVAGGPALYWQDVRPFAVRGAHGIDIAGIEGACITGSVAVGFSVSLILLERGVQQLLCRDVMIAFREVFLLILWQYGIGLYHKVAAHNPGNETARGLYRLLHDAFSCDGLDKELTLAV